MPKSDDPIEQARSHYVEKPSKAVSDNIVGLAKKYATKQIPFLGTVFDYFQSKAQKEKQQQFNDLILDQLANHYETIEKVVKRIESGGSIEAVALATERIFWGASEKKVRRFAAIVSQELAGDPSYPNVEETMAFLRAIDELSEDDIRVLKHLYNHHSHLAEAIEKNDYNAFIHNHSMRLMFEDVWKLGMSMGDFFSHCFRLSGFGLALSLAGGHGTGNPDQIPFRLTSLGKRLIDILVSVGAETTNVMDFKK